ncbi:Ig-like domain-containing protein [Novosphingobium sp. 9]|uniref:Ig-like domain-containing protein n=1 Tax=Novosphingobium sp. 9 TaxID=2025349 RepID=UPI0021B6D626|nr:Ig-like domain-containing protein [Novosphingobium sp. 9]
MDKRVEITSKVKGSASKTLHAGDGVTSIAVEQGAAVRIDVAAGTVTGMVRDGDDLVISFADGSVVRLDGYFACGTSEATPVTFADPLTGDQWLAHLADLTCVAPAETSSSPVDFTMVPLESSSAVAGGLSSGLLIGLGGLAAAGAIVAVSSGGGHNGGGSTPSGDTTPPATPTIAPSNGSVLDGTAEPGATVRLDLNGDGTVDASVTADTSGHWSYTPPSPLADGTSVTATAVDAAGNVSPPASTVTDSLAPPQPFINDAMDNAGTIQGIVVSGGFTDDATPTLEGVTEAGASVGIYDNGTLIATVTAAANGSWSYTPGTPLGEGEHAFTVVATDALGNASTASAPYTLTVDLTPPAAPVLAETDGTTIAGTAEAGALVGVDVDGDGVADLFATAADDGSWTVTADPALADGAAVSATATDAAGNVSAAAAAIVDQSLDTTPPPVPMPVVTDDQGMVQGALASGDATDDAAPMLSGTGAEAGATISIYDGTQVLGTALVQPDGTWSFEVSPPLEDGPHSLTFTATDSAGNVSASSSAFDLVVDTQAPDSPFIDPTNGSGLVGTAQAGVFVDIDIDGDGSVDATVQADANGRWSYIPAQTIPDDTVVEVTARDAAGNVSSPASTVVDANYPVVPIINAVSDDVAAGTGQIVAGGMSNDPTPTLSGIAAAGATVTVLDNGTAIGTAMANAGGAWTFTPTVALTEGNHSFTVTALDPYGVGSGPSSAYPVTFDYTAPAAPFSIPRMVQR